VIKLRPGPPYQCFFKATDKKNVEKIAGDLSPYRNIQRD
jgi:hypothetical protein